MLYRRPSFIESFKRSWRTIPVKGKIEYAFLFSVTLILIFTFGRIAWQMLEAMIAPPF